MGSITIRFLRSFEQRTDLLFVSAERTDGFA